MTLYSFRKFNPDWEMVLYQSKQKVYKKTWNDPNSQDFFTFNGKDYTNKIKELNIKIINWDINNNKINNKINLQDISSSHKSNFLKWSELYNVGGVFSDLDILFIRPMVELYEKIKNYDGMVCQTQWLSIGFMASKPGNKFFKDVFNSATKTYSNTKYQSAGVCSVFSALNCSQKTALETMKKQYKEKFYNLPFHVVYPFIGDIHSSLTRIMKINYDDKILNTIKNDTIGFHWYGGFSLSQDLNNFLNDENYKSYKNIITDLINKFNII
jgi:hypothetical protein